MEEWFFNHMGWVILIFALLGILSYVLVAYAVTQGLSDGSIAHGIGSFVYQVQQGAKGK